MESVTASHRWSDGLGVRGDELSLGDNRDRLWRRQFAAMWSVPFKSGNPIRIREGFFGLAQRPYIMGMLSFMRSFR